MLDDAGNVLGSQDYDPYGQPETAGQVGLFGYTGELQDGSTSAVYLRARWYQPGTGMLLGVDLELDSTGQAYAYAAVDPVNGSDPSGACWYRVYGLVHVYTPNNPSWHGTGECSYSDAVVFGIAAIADAPQPADAPGSDWSFNQQLDAVAATWAVPAGPGPGTPPSTPNDYAVMGTALHNAIGLIYQAVNLPDHTRINAEVRTILRDEYGIRTGPMSTVTNRPDIVNATKRFIYEIKPFGSLKDASYQLYQYLVYFWTAGLHNMAAGTQGVIPAPGGYVVYASPLPGVILYRYARGQFTPLPQGSLTGVAALVGAAALLQVAVDNLAAAAEAFGSLGGAPCPGGA